MLGTLSSEMQSAFILTIQIILPSKILGRLSEMHWAFHIMLINNAAVI